MNDAPLVEVRGLSKTYVMPERSLTVLDSVDLTIGKAEMISLEGQSGVGKSTFLHLLGTLDTPTTGSIHFEGRDVLTMPPTELAHFRNRAIGFIFQFHHLLPEFTALENIVIPQLIAGKSKADARVRASELIDAMGLEARSSHRPARLSGGEQQRIAIARALANAPKILLADEPTGNLDPGTADEVFQLLMSQVRGAGLAALIATHDPALAARMDRILRLEDGVLVAG